LLFEDAAADGRFAQKAVIRQRLGERVKSTEVVEKRVCGPKSFWTLQR